MILFAMCLVSALAADVGCVDPVTIQRQVKYKAAWEGIRVVYVGASMTSKTCSLCGSVNRALTREKAWTCPTCGARHDRDFNAALNILSRYLEAAAVRSSDEAMVLHDAVS